jgi:hypothetical protein
MSRRIRWILLALIVVLVGGAAALYFSQQPKLSDARDEVDAAWKPLVVDDQLPERYQTLEGALSAFDAAGGTDRDVSKDLHAALDAWNAALGDGDAASQVRTANTVEAQGRRLVANALGSQRLSADRAVTDSLVKFAQTTPDPARVKVYNAAARSYEDERTGALAQPVAKALGFDARPVLTIDTGNA